MAREALNPSMTPAERTLYHQIHPAKLLIDWLAGLFALYFFWHRNLLPGLLVSIIPPRNDSNDLKCEAGMLYSFLG